MVRALVVAASLVAAATLAACGDDTPERAVYVAAHAIEMEDASDLCDRLVLVGDLSASTRRSLASQPLAFPGAAAAGRGHAACEKTFGRGRIRAVPLSGALVDDVRITGPVGEARIRSTSGPPLTVPLVVRNGQWRIVVTDKSP